MTDETINLPPLPSPFGIIAPESTDDTLYSRADLAAYARAYARAAVLADRQIDDLRDDIADVASKALLRAYALGQRYWQQADSEYVPQNKKADDTQHKFDDLIDTTRMAILKSRSSQADMFWDANDPEHFGGESLHDTLCDMMDNAGPGDFPLTVRLQCARRLPDIQVRVAGRNEDDELQYEELKDGHD